MSTLREIHERCKTRHGDHMTVNEMGDPFDLCDACDMPWPCPDYADAVAALAILDTAGFFDRAVIGSTRDEHGEPTYIRCRLVPDPEPSA